MPKLERIASVVLLLYLTLGTCSAIGLCLGRCGKEIFRCQCGSQPDQILEVSVQKCTFFYKWKPYCHASDGNGERVKEEDICPKYKQCLTCEIDGGSCSTCPPGKSGTFCNRYCPCQNGGQCTGSSDHCTCPPAFQGRYCETNTGCPPLQVTPPITAAGLPEVNPQHMEFSCPSPGYLLEGSSTLTCIPGTYRWNHPIPTCVPACTVPEGPSNGGIINAPDNSLVRSGQSLEFQCNYGLTLIGASKTICMADGTWSDKAPDCIQVRFCLHPEPVPYATYEQYPPPSHPLFSNGTKIVFTCLEGHLLFGQSQLVCGDDGQWSSDMPTCVKVSDSEVNCTTHGSQVVLGLGKHVRIHCPPNCGSTNANIWGTIIYEEASSVCRAAVHSGRISNTLGGSLFVLNNGPYNDFLNSTINGITSERKSGISGSFRFHHDPDLDLQNKEDFHKGCPLGWTELQGHCVYAVTKRHAWGASKMICNNMGSRLPSLKDPAFIKEVLKSRGTDVESFWLLSKTSNDNITSTSFPLWVGDDDALNPDITEILLEEDENSPEPAHASCNLVNQLPGGSSLAIEPCSEPAPFICDIDLRPYQVRCDDRDQLEDGLVLLQDPEFGFRRGAVVHYQCKEMHVLRGEASSTCLPNGSWSSSLPVCQRISACVDPPAVKFGFLHILKPHAPGNSRKGWLRNGPITRRNRIGSSEPVRHARSVFEEIADLPAGYHRVGSRAAYSCESKYYDQIGSKTRRCQKDGSWSGTPVTCIPVCGLSDSPRTPFITGGNSTDVGQWPWQIGIAHTDADVNSSFILCGGTLLSELWIVTAAHCVVDELSGLPLRPEEILLYAGKYNRDDLKDDSFVQIRKASDVRVHPHYDSSTYDSDIALIKMSSPVTLTSRVRPVCLPSARSTLANVVAGRKGVVTGWGLNELSKYTDTLEQAVLPVVSHEECEEGYKEAGLPLSVTENMFCAGLLEGRTDTCSGDSGGPMVFQMYSGSSKYWVLEGIVSWGSLAGCGNRRQYGGFTKVHRFLDWIEQNI